jgi:hypothetical protein
VAEPAKPDADAPCRVAYVGLKIWMQASPRREGPDSKPLHLVHRAWESIPTEVAITTSIAAKTKATTKSHIASIERHS